jgi:phosphoglycolate phosphatase-like HAD superfamily hydrolase
VGDLLVLWDVDGTLLNAGGVGGDLYEIVFSSMFGRRCERLAPMAGRTDRAIILDTLEMAGVPEPRRYVDRFIEGLRTHAPAMFEAAQRQGRILPGAADAITAVASARVAASTIGFTVPATALAPAPVLAGDPAPAPVLAPASAFIAAATTPFGVTAGASPQAGPAALAAMAMSVAHDAFRLPPHSRRRPESGRVYQSVLTGNVRTLAEVKLRAVGLSHPLDLCIGAYGDDHEIRTELVHLARRRASDVYDRATSDFSGEATIVVGDTPLDIEAALAAGARAVGVATGGYSVHALRAAGAHAVLSDLTNTTAVLSGLLSWPRQVP